MRALALEIRDSMTFIPALAVSTVARTEADGYLIRRAGYDAEHPCVVLTRLDGGEAHYDPYDWSNRTWKVAHEYIAKNWRDLSDGDVIDVEHILGESSVKKASERIEHPA